MTMSSSVFGRNGLIAVSIARRLQDPLSELVKIEPKHIGVGMYQVLHCSLLHISACLCTCFTRKPRSRTL